MASFRYLRLPLEGRLLKGLWLHWLAIPTERPEETRFPGGVGAIDEALRDYIVLLSPDKWPDARGMDPATAQNSTRMLARTLAIYYGCRCFGFLYNEAFLTRPPIEILDGREPRGYTVTSKYLRHHILHLGVEDGDSHPFPDEYICWLFQPPAESSQVLVCGVWACYRGDIALCWDSGDTNWDTPPSIPWSTTDRLPPRNPRLAADGGEDGDTPGMLTRKAAVPRGLPSPGEGSPLHHSNVLHIGFSDVCKGAAAPRGCHAEFFLARGWLCRGGGGAFVAWSSVCRPFADGGLGLRHLKYASSVLLSKWVV